MDRIRERSEDKTMNKWLDTQDVCQTLNICPRTVQTLRIKWLLYIDSLTCALAKAHVLFPVLHYCYDKISSSSPV